MNKRFVLSMCVGAAVLGFAGAAAASPAIMTGTVNVRTGPGLYYQIIGKAYDGQPVDVQGCQQGWCYVNKAGPDGWVSARYSRARAARASTSTSTSAGGRGSARDPVPFGPGPGPRPGPIGPGPGPIGPGPGPGPGLPPGFPPHP